MCIYGSPICVWKCQILKNKEGERTLMLCILLFVYLWAMALGPYGHDSSFGWEVVTASQVD